VLALQADVDVIEKTLQTAKSIMKKVSGGNVHNMENVDTAQQALLK